MSNRVLHSLVLPIIRINLEEVAIHYVTEPGKDFRVYPLALEKMIDILTRATQFTGKPCHRPLLSSEFFFNKVSDMWCFLRGHCPQGLGIEKAWNCFLLETQGFHALRTLQVFHAVRIRHLLTCPWFVCPHKEDFVEIWVSRTAINAICCMSNVLY